MTNARSGLKTVELTVMLPFWVVRIGVGADLDMPLDWRIRFLQQGELSLRSIFLFFCGGSSPVRGCGVDLQTAGIEAEDTATVLDAFIGAMVSGRVWFVP
jgi:hypothetical protein